MGRKVDITDKLTFDQNPALIIRGQELEVNADAPTMLKVMSLINGEGDDIEQIEVAYKLVFTEESRKIVEEMKLSVPDWMILVQEAMALITGDISVPGES